MDKPHHDFYAVISPADNDHILIFSQQHLWLTENDAIPRWREIKSLVSEPLNYYCFSSAGQQRYLLAYGHCPASLPQRLQSLPFKQIWVDYIFGEDLALLAARGYHLKNWLLSHQYCGCCGSPLQDKAGHPARVCNQCQFVAYPRISPCIIVLVTHGRKVLLAHGYRMPKGIYSTLAGFIEPGETAEEAIHREVFEEVKIELSQVRYIASQPWPFPDNLMLGYIGEYKKGQIQPDKEEIEDAQWFDIDNLPKLPPKVSISHTLIATYLQHCRNS
jgi:NAD+ diphosphatase